MRTRLLWGTLLCLAGLTAAAPAQPLAASPQAAKHFEAQIKVTARLDYLLFLPEGYAKSKQRWPLMLFLHGAGEAPAISPSPSVSGSDWRASER